MAGGGFELVQGQGWHLALLRLLGLLRHMRLLRACLVLACSLGAELGLEWSLRTWGRVGRRMVMGMQIWPDISRWSTGAMRCGICCRWSCTGVGMRNIWSAVGLQALRDRAVLRQVDAHLRLQGTQVTTLQLPSCYMGLRRSTDAGAGACRLWALSVALRQVLCWPGSWAGVGGWGGGVALGGAAAA